VQTLLMLKQGGRGSQPQKAPFHHSPSAHSITQHPTAISTQVPSTELRAQREVRSNQRQKSGLAMSEEPQKVLGVTDLCGGGDR
jgi:hypothetical protein